MAQLTQEQKEWVVQEIQHGIIDFLAKKSPGADPRDTLTGHALNDLNTVFFTGPVSEAARIQDCVYSCDTTGGDVDIALPSAAYKRQMIVVINENATANETIVTPTGGDSIGPSGPISMTLQYEFLVLVSDGVATWNVIGRGTWAGASSSGYPSEYGFAGAF